MKKYTTVPPRAMPPTTPTIIPAITPADRPDVGTLVADSVAVASEEAAAPEGSEVAVLAAAPEDSEVAVLVANVVDTEKGPRLAADVAAALTNEVLALAELEPLFTSGNNGVKLYPSGPTLETLEAGPTMISMA
jgi:hypothetical protein